MMEYIWFSLAVFFTVGGLIGCFIPVIPGLFLSWSGLLIAFISETVDVSRVWMILSFLIVLAISLFEFYLPALFTKKFGGTKCGEYGSTVGGVVGVFFSPLGIILMPFIGAFIGELLCRNHNDGYARALKSAFGSFVGFVVGTGLKVTVAAWFIFFLLKKSVLYGS